jgi:anthranilate synthase component 1
MIAPVAPGTPGEPTAGDTPGVVAVEWSADTLTPVSAALRLQDRLAFILESVEGGARYGRYSFVGVRGRTLVVNDGTAVVWDPDYTELERFDEPDPLEALRRVLPTGSGAGRGATTFPFPLDAGVGYVAYDAAARWERLPVPDADPIGLPEAVFHMPAVVIAFDHLAQTATLATTADDGAHERIARVAERLARPVPDEAPVRLGTPGVRPPRPMPPAADPAYEAGVAKLVEDIHAGEMLQVVPARRFAVRNRASALTIYRALRRINPSPYLFAVDLGPGRSILGASPELLVKVHDREVVTRPLAGTRPRSDDPVRDAELEADLLADAKELAEHAMLVDLARNDVGRVAEPGSVEWPLLYGVERYSHVMHLVSEVRGTLRAERDAFDALRATFPAGTLSGAPKVRAMQAIAEVEQARRGPYGGAVGYFAPDDLEVAIIIRSVVLKDDTAFVQAGAGVVADSVPSRESAEVAAKASAVLAALAEAGRGEEGAPA